MSTWLKAFAGKYGVHGLLSLAVVLLSLLALQSNRMLPSAHGDAVEAAGEASKAVEKATQKMDQHIEQAHEQTKVLREIREQLKQNHDTQARSGLLLCLRLSKTSAERDKCADIP